MKKLILIFMFLFFFRGLTFAQKDSVKVLFSEETVEKFEKTTLLDEYDKAFGGNRVVKSGLRFSIAQPNLHADKIVASISFEQKIAPDKSIIGRVSNGTGIYHSEHSYELESRWYYKMKERVKAGIQSPNITGKYLSLKYQYEPFVEADIYSKYHYLGFPINQYMFRETSTFSLNWGRQFGNNVAYNFTFGIKNGKESYRDSKGYWLNDSHSPTKSTWFISANSQMGFGLYLPRKKRTPSNYCEFLRCNYEVNKLLKINVNNAFYLDMYNQGLKADVSYERKIGHTAFSINSNILVSFENHYRYEQIGTQDSIINRTKNSFSTIRIPFFSSKKVNNFINTFEINEQIRYYVGMKQRIIKGKSASNLNGIYTGGQVSYKTSSIKYYYYPSHYSNPIVGAILGYQTQTNRKSFLDIGIFMGKPIKFLQPNMNGPFFLEFNLKLGFAK